MSRPPVWLLLTLLSGSALAQDSFDRDFTGATLRLDLHHTGDQQRELFSLERARIEGPWSGNPRQPIDGTNLGKYLLEVVSLADNRLLYSRGFARIYGEWETTGEAARRVRTLAEALRLPEPRAPVQVRLRKRDDRGTFREVWSLEVDPSDRRIFRGTVPPGRVEVLIDGGPPRDRVDLLLLGDGYTEREREKFLSDARRLTEALFAVEPFAARRTDFNVRALFTPALESGISRPRSGLYRDSPLGTSYDSFGSERYVLTLDDRAWRDAAAAVPYEFVVILVNSEKYGGGGILNLYATAAVDSGFSDYLFVHEFGHHFAGLGDEYYTSPVAYEESVGPSTEPWEPNITALLAPERLKWRHLIEETTPLPTPWEKDAFEETSRAFQDRRRALRQAGAAETELEALFVEEREQFTRTLGAERFSESVGAFEGASYQARGLYRPSVDCVMFTRDEVGFCPVCNEAIQRVIDLYTR
jgi:hypothetical protein